LSGISWISIPCACAARYISCETDTAGLLPLSRYAWVLSRHCFCLRAVRQVAHRPARFTAAPHCLQLLVMPPVYTTHHTWRVSLRLLPSRFESCWACSPDTNINNHTNDLEWWVWWVVRVTGLLTPQHPPPVTIRFVEPQRHSRACACIEADSDIKILSVQSVQSRSSIELEQHAPGRLAIRKLLLRFPSPAPHRPNMTAIDSVSDWLAQTQLLRSVVVVCDTLACARLLQCVMLA
jgi:hypothetical protein